MTRAAPLAVGVLGYGLLRAPGLRRIMDLAGHPLRFGLPVGSSEIAVWGQRPSARRGALVAKITRRNLLRVEDCFLRGLAPGQGDHHAPYGVLIDHTGVHFDARGPSNIETLLATHPLDDPALLARAQVAMARLSALGGGKYLAHDPDTPPPPDGHVLIVDQVKGDASVTASGADRATFLRMLDMARRQFPDRPLVVKTHPATTARRPGHLHPDDLRAGDLWCDTAIAPKRLLARAHRVMTVSSQMGLDAIWAGHRPMVFGTPIYSGWGLTEQDNIPARRGRTLSSVQMFAALMILAPVWYDPFRDRLCDIEAILDIAEAEARAATQDLNGYVAHGMSLWKRRHICRSFGGNVIFPLTTKGAAQAVKTRPVLAWASAPAPPPAPNIIRVEDGFLRSRGLGARLIPPMALIADDQGAYYDPAHPSRLETLIADSPNLPPHALTRAETLVDQILQSQATKYSQGGAQPVLPNTRPRILVVGQVENDASIRHGATGPVRTNAALLAAARAANPSACLIYKPHPDVEANLRPGKLVTPGPADIILHDTDPGWLLPRVDEVWTLTSLMGFEALLRGIPVTCLGAPFYAGWGLTKDCAPVPRRRTAIKDVTVTGLAHAALIGAPRYIDPQTSRICPPEIILARIATTTTDSRPLVLRLAAKTQGAWITLRSNFKP